MRKIILQYLIGFCLLAGSMMAHSAAAPPEQLLRKRATSVTNTSGWHAHAHHTFGWCWLSERKVLFARDNDGRDTYFLRDVGTGKETKLSRLTNFMHKFCVCNAPRLSPDSKWMLIDKEIGGDKMELVALDGSKHFSILQRSASAVWLPDSRHFLLAKDDVHPQNHTCFLYDITNSAHIRRNIAQLQMSPEDIERSVTTRHNVITIDDNADDTNKVIIHQRASYWKSSPDRRTIINMPQGAKLENACLSPSGDQLVYTLTVKRTTFRQASRYRPASSGVTKPLTFMEIWRSDIRGRHLRRLISLPKYQADEYAIHFPLNVDWLPGGKALAVEYHCMLYTMPAN